MGESRIEQRAGGGAGLALALLMLAGAVNYVDRVTLSVAAPMISAQLHLKAGAMGVLLSAFLWTYALAQWPAGALIDRLGPRRLLGGALVLWSAAQAATGLAAGLPQLVTARMCLGLGEAPQFPVGARVVRSWFSQARRGLATGAFNSASTLGPAIAPPIVTALMLSFGWRGAFVATGAAGLVAAALWIGLYRDQAPPDGGGAAPSMRFADLPALLRAPTLWAMAAGNLGSGYMTWFYAAWLPSYLASERHFSLPQVGWAAAVPYLFGFAGSLTGGWACDRLAAAGLTPLASRKAPIVAGLAAGAVCTGLALLPPEGASGGGWALAAICGALFSANVATAAIWALAVAAAPARFVASVGAVQNFGGLVGGALAPIVTGLTVEATHGFSVALSVTTLAGLTGAAIYLVGVRAPLADPTLGAGVGADIGNHIGNGAR
jgi:MFS family permease